MKRTGGTAVSVDIHGRDWLQGPYFSGKKSRCVHSPVQEAGRGMCIRMHTRCLAHEPAYIQDEPAQWQLSRCSPMQWKRQREGPRLYPRHRPPLYLLELMFYLATDCNACTTRRPSWFSSHHIRGDAFDRVLRGWFARWLVGVRIVGRIFRMDRKQRVLSLQYRLYRR